MGVEVDSLGRSYIILDSDTIHTAFLPQPELVHSGPLRPCDYDEIASELGIEPAAIRAVVEIETGRLQKGFNADGSVIINFDLPVFRRAAARRGVDLTRYAGSAAVNPVNIARYGSQQAAQHARLEAALAIDSVAAVESTFWGMFQIGGFNWKLCGTASREEFVERMTRSEYDQLSLRLHVFTMVLRMLPVTIIPVWRQHTGNIVKVHQINETYRIYTRGNLLPKDRF